MYSQNDEEAHILRAVEGMAPGTFLDIGAFHATQLSNTRCLFERGWSGVLVEPSPGPMRGLLEVYGNEPRIQLVQAAVGHGDLLSMQVTDDAVSSVSAEHFGKWKHYARYLGTLLVPSISIKVLLVMAEHPEVISIDVEGNSLETLHDLMLSLAITGSWQPRCIICEHDGVAEANMRPTGYELMTSNAENYVWRK